MTTEPPTELDRLDPPPKPPRPPRRVKGDVEKAVLANLAALKVDWRREGIAAGVVILARRLDDGGLSPRDEAGNVARIQMGLTQLRDWNPGGAAGDSTDEARAQVESTRALYVVPEA